MIKLLVLLAASLVLAYRSEQNTRTACAAGYRYSLGTDLAYVGLVLILTLFAGLRTSYNDSPLSSKRQKNICVTRHLGTGDVF